VTASGVIDVERTDNIMEAQNVRTTKSELHSWSSLSAVDRAQVRTCRGGARCDTGVYEAPGACVPCRFYFVQFLLVRWPSWYPCIAA
jgi:hypothetical protein